MLNAQFVNTWVLLRELPELIDGEKGEGAGRVAEKLQAHYTDSVDILAMTPEAEVLMHQPEMALIGRNKAPAYLTLLRRFRGKPLEANRCNARLVWEKNWRYRALFALPAAAIKITLRLRLMPRRLKTAASSTLRCRWATARRKARVLYLMPTPSCRQKERRIARWTVVGLCRPVKRDIFSIVLDRGSAFSWE